MNINSDPNAGSFRPHMSGGATPSSDAAPTERLANFRPPQRIVSQPARSQRTRRTVDLPAPTHRALDIWQREAADRLGVARVTGQEVLAALVDQLLTDPKLSAQITRAIQARR
ncbi:ATPase [Mycobacterium sp.]|uniref:ATPase n=1 Tax=Mycobacterium sp. TaxID=1785 RepID=UPI0039C9C614